MKDRKWRKWHKPWQFPPRAERKIRRTMCKYVSARGDRHRRRVVYRKLQRQRVAFQVSDDRFLDWFSSIARVFSTIENGAARKRVTSVHLREYQLIQRLRDHYAQHQSASNYRSTLM